MENRLLCFLPPHILHLGVIFVIIFGGMKQKKEEIENDLIIDENDFICFQEEKYKISALNWEISGILV